MAHSPDNVSTDTILKTSSAGSDTGKSACPISVLRKPSAKPVSTDGGSDIIRLTFPITLMDAIAIPQRSRITAAEYAKTVRYAEVGEIRSRLKVYPVMALVAFMLFLPVNEFATAIMLIRIAVRNSTTADAPPKDCSISIYELAPFTFPTLIRNTADNPLGIESAATSNPLRHALLYKKTMINICSSKSPL